MSNPKKRGSAKNTINTCTNIGVPLKILYIVAGEIILNLLNFASAINDPIIAPHTTPIKERLL